MALYGNTRTTGNDSSRQVLLKLTRLGEVRGLMSEQLVLLALNKKGEALN